MDSEIWKPVLGYEGRYEASNLGNVRTLRSHRGYQCGHVLAVRTARNGYLLTTLYDGNKLTTYSTHRLVAEAFLGKRPPQMEVNHIDGDKRNNRIENLEYVSGSQNQRHAYRTGLQVNKRRRFTEQEVKDLLPRILAATNLTVLGRELGVHRTTVKNIKTGHSYKHIRDSYLAEQR